MPLTSQEASYIYMESIGCRYGTTIEGAAYGFSDIVGEGRDYQAPSMQEAIGFMQDPEREPYQPRWDQRLYSTCYMIVGLSDSGTVILVNRAIPTAERYNSHSEVGDGYTFAKVNRLPSSSEILARITYGDGEAIVAETQDPGCGPLGVDVDEGLVKQLASDIMVQLQKLAAKWEPK